MKQIKNIFLEGESPTLIYILKLRFPAIYNIKLQLQFSVHQAQTDGLSDEAKMSKFLSYNLPRYNIEKLI